SQRQPGGADALEIEIASEIVTAGSKWRRWRIEARLQSNERPDRRSGALAHRQADALGSLRETRGFQGDDIHDDAIGGLALLARLHETGDADAVSRGQQDGVVYEATLERRGRKPGRDGGAPDRSREAEWACAQLICGSDDHRADGRRNPPDRLPVG